MNISYATPSAPGFWTVLLHNPETGCSTAFTVQADAEPTDGTQVLRDLLTRCNVPGDFVTEVADSLYRTLPRPVDMLPSELYRQAEEIIIDRARLRRLLGTHTLPTTTHQETQP